MPKTLSLKKILTTLIGTGIVSGLMTLPTRANEDHLASELRNSEIVLSQNFYNYSDLPNDRDRESSNNFNKIVGLTGLAIGTGVIGWHLTRAYKPSLVNSIPTKSSSNALLLDRVSPKLRKQLTRLVHDRQTANRLLSGTLMKHPNRSPNWLAEKVIYDLKRDR